MDLQKVREALRLASDYINSGELLPQNMDHPYFKTSAAIDEALAELEKQADVEAWGVARQVYDGIAADLARLSDTYVFNPFASACLIQQYAESYHTRKLSEESAAILAASDRLGAALDESDKLR